MDIFFISYSYNNNVGDINIVETRICENYVEYKYVYTDSGQSKN